MEISMQTQLVITAYALFVGIVIGLLYDVTRIARVFFGITETAAQQRLEHMRLPLIGARCDRKGNFAGFCGLRSRSGDERKKKAKPLSALYQNIVVFFGDIFFFLIVSPFFTIFIYYANSGKIRWYLMLGAMLGFLLYYFTIGRMTMLFSGLIVFVIRSIGAYVVWLTVRPLLIAGRWIGRMARRCWQGISGRVRDAVRLRQMKRYTEKEEKSISAMAKADW